MAKRFGGVVVVGVLSEVVGLALVTVGVLERNDASYDAIVLGVLGVLTMLAGALALRRHRVGVLLAGILGVGACYELALIYPMGLPLPLIQALAALGVAVRGNDERTQGATKIEDLDDRRATPPPMRAPLSKAKDFPPLR